MGRRKPNKGSFKKGQSGNPGGRPKVVADVRAAAREHTSLGFEVLVDVATDRDAPASARVAAAIALHDRGWGRPTQAVEMSGPGGGPIDVRNLAGLSDEQLEQLEGAFALGASAAAGSGAADAGRGPRGEDPPEG